MKYEKYYPGGWQSGEEGGTPITPEALNHMESGILNAAELSYAKKVGAPHNLLDNSDFRNPVNQRGTTTGVEWGYLIDRWTSANSNTAVTAKGVQIPPGGCWFYQRLPIAIYNKAKDKGLTAAIKLVGGEILVTRYGTQATASDGTILRLHNDGSSTEYFEFRIMSSPGGSTVEWAALYEGEYTAETLPAYQPKGYAAELTECRRYFRKYDAWDGLCTGFIGWQNDLQVYIPTDIPMRVNPTCSAIEGNVVVNGVYVAVNKTPTAVQKNGLIVLSFPGYTVAAEHGAQPCALILGEKGLTLSADL